MKSAFLLFLAALLFSVGCAQTMSSPSSATPQGSKPLWTLTAGIENPESVYFDAESRRLFVSNVAGSPVDRDGKGSVAEIVESYGRTRLKTLVDGLNAPKGLRAKDGVLYVTDIDELIAIDLAQGKIRTRTKIAGAQFLNDEAIASDGTVYVSDTLGNKIYAVKDGGASVFAAGDELESPNGLLLQGDRLIVAAWGLIVDPGTFGVEIPGNLYALDLKTKAKTVITKAPLGNLDGLEFDGRDFLVSDFAASKVYRVGSDGTARLIFQGQHNAADIGFDGSNLYVPEMGGGSVVALPL